MVLEHVRRKYNKEYKARGMRNVLRKVGFVIEEAKASQREES